MFARALQVGLAHPHEELRLLALEAIRRPALRALAFVGELRIHVEEEGRVGLQPRVHEALEPHDEIARQAAPAALVGVGRVTESVAHDPGAGRERGLDHVGHMLGARREHEERLGLGVHRAVPHQLADLLAGMRTAGLARERGGVAARAHQLAQELEVRRLAGAVDALERDELSAVHHLPSWYFATARLCSSSERVNSWVPSPRATK